MPIEHRVAPAAVIVCIVEFRFCQVIQIRGEQPHAHEIAKDQEASALHVSIVPVEQTEKVGHAEAVAQAVHDERRKEVARANEEKRRVDAEYVRVGELKEMHEHDGHRRNALTGIVGVLLEVLEHVMQVCQAEEQRRNEDGRVQRHVRVQNAQHGRAIDEF